MASKSNKKDKKDKVDNSDEKKAEEINQRQDKDSKKKGSTASTIREKGVYYVARSDDQSLTKLYDYSVNTDLYRATRHNSTPNDPSDPSNPDDTFTTLTIGHARSGENGITGNSPGDSNGKEVCTRDIYYPRSGWTVFRATDEAKRAKIAECMLKACKNDKIGYDQSGRDTLYNAIKNKGYNPDKVTSKVETDCSALVRVCCCYAGISVKDFVTSTEEDTLMSLTYTKGDNRGKKKFKKVGKAWKSSDAKKFKAGDILLTSGHTAVVVADYGGGKCINVPSSYNGHKLGTYATREFSTGYLKTFSWAKGSSQRKIFNKWKDKGYPTKNGFAAIDGKYLIACTSTFGKIGHRVIWEFSDGSKLDTIIADFKCQTYTSYDHNPANKWGHADGKCMIEFCGVPKSLRGKSAFNDPYYYFKLHGETVTKVYKCGQYVKL